MEGVTDEIFTSRVQIHCISCWKEENKLKQDQERLTVYWRDPYKIKLMTFFGLWLHTK